MLALNQNVQVIDIHFLFAGVMGASDFFFFFVIPSNCCTQIKERKKRKERRKEDKKKKEIKKKKGRKEGQVMKVITSYIHLKSCKYSLNI